MVLAVLFAIKFAVTRMSAVLLLAGLGGAVGDIRGADGDLRQGRRREHQLRSRHLHPHHRRHGDARPSPGWRPGNSRRPASISGRTYLFLLLSGLGTGASWLCYFRALKIGEAAQVAPIDKLSVVLVAVFGVALSRRAAVGAELARHRADRGRRRAGRLPLARQFSGCSA